MNAEWMEWVKHVEKPELELAIATRRQLFIMRKHLATTDEKALWQEELDYLQAEINRRNGQ